MDEDEPEGTESEAPPEPVSGSLAWWRLQINRPAEELRSDREFQMQLQRVAVEAGVLNKNLPVRLELNLIMRAHGIKPADLERMDVLELIKLQDALLEQEQQSGISLDVYRYSTEKFRRTYDLRGAVPYDAPYDPKFFPIPVPQLLNSALLPQRPKRGRKTWPHSAALNEALNKLVTSPSELDDPNARRTIFRRLDSEKLPVVPRNDRTNREGTYSGLLRPGKEEERDKVVEALKKRVKNMRKKPKSPPS